MPIEVEPWFQGFHHPIAEAATEMERQSSQNQFTIIVFLP